MNTKIDYELYKDKGLSGLANLGNTCFMNSCIQVLSHTYEFSHFLNSEQFHKKLQQNNESEMLIEWNQLRQILWRENCIVSPGKFLGCVQKLAKLKKNELFTGFSQNDLPEFLLFIINSFHTALARKVNMNILGTPQNETDEIALKCFEMIKNMYCKEYSEVWNLFFGVHVSQMIDLESGNVLQTTPEPYFMIDLPIPQINENETTLLSCLELYVKGEKLEGENAWYNENTKQKENVLKKISFWSLPNILVFTFKRFNHRNMKNQKLIHFRFENLNLSNYVLGYKKEDYIYDLYGICNHSGTPLGGHYTSFVKNANGKWYHFNDTMVSEVSNLQSMVTPKAYCLFYRKKTK